MSQFSRRSAWLAALFPQSVAPASRDPNQRSDDVSLTQPYDGGGLNIVGTSFPAEFDTTLGPLIITEPFVGIMDFLSKEGITTVSDLFNISDELVCRLLVISTTQTAGIGAERTFFIISPPNESGVTNHQVSINGENSTVAAPSDTMVRALQTNTMLPGTQLSYFFSTGAADSRTRISIQMIIAPVGTVFYT